MAPTWIKQLTADHTANKKKPINSVNEIVVFEKSSGTLIVLNPKWCFKSNYSSQFFIILSHGNSKQCAESNSITL